MDNAMSGPGHGHERNASCIQGTHDRGKRGGEDSPTCGNHIKRLGNSHLSKIVKNESYSLYMNKGGGRERSLQRYRMVQRQRREGERKIVFANGQMR